MNVSTNILHIFIINYNYSIYFKINFMIRRRLYLPCKADLKAGFHSRTRMHQDGSPMSLYNLP
jgi:hypothetical protein